MPPPPTDYEIRGGQLWEQPDFPCCRRYIIYLPNGRFAMAMPPMDSEGSLVCTTNDWGCDGGVCWQWDGAELEARLRSLHYVNRGQFRAVELAQWDEILAGVALRHSGNP